MDYEEECKVLERCLPKSPFRGQVEKLHKAMIKDLSKQGMEIAYLHDLLTGCGNEFFECDSDGRWISDKTDSGFMRNFCIALNRTIFG